MFIIATVAISTIEYFTGYILEKIFNRKYWDYTEDPLNLHGRICFHFSLMWGIVAVISIKLVHPFLSEIINKLSTKGIISLSIILFTLITIDFFSTLLSLIDIKKILSNFENKCKKILG